MPDTPSLSDSNSQLRPRRSALYMPGANPRALEKAKSLPADCLVFDLEDAVHPDDKVMARQAVCAAIASGGYGAREIVVRINALDTLWGMDDVLALSQVTPDALLVPKVNMSEDIMKVSMHLPDGLALWAMMETPQGILNAGEIAACARSTPLAALVFGSNDLLKDMRASMMSNRAPLQTSMSLCVLAARANGLAVLDGVYNDYKDGDGLLEECRQGVAYGFDGKTLIHPDQLSVANSVFAPSSDAIAEAETIVAAFDRPENAGKGVITIAGKMTERLHYDQSKQILALAAHIRTFEAKFQDD